MYFEFINKDICPFIIGILIYKLSTLNTHHKLNNSQFHYYNFKQSNFNLYLKYTHSTLRNEFRLKNKTPKPMYNPNSITYTINYYQIKCNKE